MKIIISKILELYKKYKEIVNYIIFGVIATAINIGVFAILNLLLGENLYLISNILAIIASVLFQYFSNKFFVFERKTLSKKETFMEFVKFISARAVTAVLDMVIMFIGVSLLNVSEILMKVITNIIVVILNYVLSKFFVFKKTAKNKKSEQTK